MAANSQGEILFDHLERFLGSMKHRWLGKSGLEQPFEVFVFLGQPEPDCQCLVTFGLSAHHLEITGEGDGTTRMELAVCANSSFESKALGALLFAVGVDAIKHHTTPGIHGILEGSGAVLSGGNAKYEHLYLASPGYFPREFEWCKELHPPVAIVQLIPITSGERLLISNKGWDAFEDALVEQSIDLLAFDARKAIA